METRSIGPTKKRAERIADCNQYSAGYQANGDALVIGSIAHSERQCLGPDGVMTQEADYLNALLSAAGFSTSLTGLELLDTEGDVLAEYRLSGRIR